MDDDVSDMNAEATLVSQHWRTSWQTRIPRRLGVFRTTASPTCFAINVEVGAPREGYFGDARSGQDGGDDPPPTEVSSTVSFDGRCTCISVIHFRSQNERSCFSHVRIQQPRGGGAEGSRSSKWDELSVVRPLARSHRTGDLESVLAWVAGLLRSSWHRFGRRRLGVQGRVRPRPRTLGTFSTCDLR